MDLSRADLQQPIERAREAGPARRVLDVSVAVVRQVMDDDVLELSAAMSYRFFMAIFPFAIRERARAGAEVGAASTRGTKTPEPARETPSR